ncbi:MAG: hypothetical protein V2A34_11330 [Lentisphaerota bacterium]
MNKARLAREIATELAQLRRVAELADSLSRLSIEQRRPWDVAAAAKYTADLYSGFENILKRWCKENETKLPEGPDFHRRLLDAFLQEPFFHQWVSPEFADHLFQYLRFRHRFIHGYGHELKWEHLEEPLRLVANTVEQIEEIWNAWLASLTPGIPSEDQ